MIAAKMEFLIETKENKETNDISGNNKYEN